MADEPQVVRGIDWKSTFPFTQIFRSFRIAIHPSKLVLALLALLLIYVGGRVLDAVWPKGSLAAPEEVRLYVSSLDETDPPRAFRDERAQVRARYEQRLNQRLEQIGKKGGTVRDVRWAIVQTRNQEAEAARKAYDEYVKNNEAAIKEKPQLKETAAADRDRRIAAAYAAANDEYASYAPARGVGLFATLLEHQLDQSRAIGRQAREGNWISTNGVLDQVVNFFTVGPAWAMRHHPVFFTIFFLYCLVIWAIFGGAIARIAAVHVARDEKISFRQALSFSTAKFLSFVSAPIIPLLIVLVVGIVVALGGLIFNIPFIGPILGGGLFFLALAAGFVMTLVLIGLLGGFNLMYPTIAVEGSDSFDAISRSFSYLYARPWRLIFYTIVAAIYGLLCYAFVYYFVWIMLGLTRFFAGLLVFTHADNAAPLWPMLWPGTPAGRLSYDLDLLTLAGGQELGAFLLAFWIYLTIAMVGAFVLSFYFSANTVIYVLMRHEVDATELDDVYLEQTDEDFGEMTASSAAATTTAVATSGGGETPPDTTTVVAPAPSAPPETPPPPASPENPPPPEGQA